jgi:hypothetical protein
MTQIYPSRASNHAQSYILFGEPVQVLDLIFLNIEMFGHINCHLFNV